MKTQFSSSLDIHSTVCILIKNKQFNIPSTLDVSFDIPDFKHSILYHHDQKQYLLLEHTEKDTLLSIGGKIITEISKHQLQNPLIIPPDTDNLLDFFSGILMGSYRFNHYFSEPKNKQPTAVTLFGEQTVLFDTALSINEGVSFTRDLITEPSNTLTPEVFKDRLVETLEPLGVEVTVLNEKDILDKKMMALHGVARGSRKPPFVVAMHWKGNTEMPLAIAGKGVCFDTGGISLKPPGRMHEMKYDMGGAGCVAGLMYTLAKRQANANVVGVVGLVENMPDGDAQNPGDVVRSMSGQTIEILNTDAEGRLVLADVLTYIQEDFKPKAIIDLATLTGAITVALGEFHAGLFSNNDLLSDQLLNAGLSTNEKLWRLPISEEYDNQINSTIADMQNIGKGGAGSITAAQFIGRFVKNDTPWAHLDIAGVTWSDKPKPYAPTGATGYGVRLLNNFVSEYFETN